MLLLKKILLLAVLFSLTTLSKAQDSEIIQETKNQIQEWLNKIPQGYEAEYGFYNRDEFKKVEIHKIIPVYFFDKEEIKSYPIWRVPIEIKSEYRLLATIIEKNGIYKIVDLGASVLAKDIQNIIKKSKIKSNKIGFFRSTKMRADFLINSNNDYIPLTSAKEYFDKKSSKENFSKKEFSEKELLNIINQIPDEKN